MPDTHEHPGVFVKKHVLPKGLTVKAAAELLAVSRPTLSNLLNGKAALSPEMALRLEKTFGVSQKELLEKQATFDRIQNQSRGQDIAVRAYVPSFLRITAREIEGWAHSNLQARSLLPVLLRKLVHSTGQLLTKADFPGYDEAERKGWDGLVEAGAATPWIPQGKSGWEFGCNEDVRRKAEGDYASRLGSVQPQERAETTFVFVTPRNWNGKGKWLKEKARLNEWKSVQAYDASDLEQWLEQSIPAQGWIAEQMGMATQGAHSLDEEWKQWATVTRPELSRELFRPSVERHKSTLESWLQHDPSDPLIVCADSRIEALAFLSCAFEADELSRLGIRDRAVVFSSPETLSKLLSSSSNLIPIIYTEGAERELGGSHGKVHSIIVRPRNMVDIEPNIALDLLNYESLKKALEAMGLNHHDTERLVRESGYSPTILRRRLSRNPAIKAPPWAQDAEAVEGLIPMALVGAWHAQSKADCEILALLSGKTYDDVEKRIAALLRYDDSPVWAAGRFRGVSSKIDALFAVHGRITQKDLEEFLFAAEVVLSESDPAVDLPDDKKPFAGLYGKTREHSSALREGICETLALLASHGNQLLQERLGIDIKARIDALVRRLLTPLTPERLLSQAKDLPLYAEAAPEVFLAIIEEDLAQGKPQTFELLKPSETGIFGAGCPRSGLLWALECLAWKAENLLRVALILAKLTEHKIEDNWVNKPNHSLSSIFRSWMPQTAASIEQRKKALEALTKRFPSVAWQLCLEQLSPGMQVGNYNYRPRWRSDATGAGQGVTHKERYEFAVKALELAIAWPNHNESTLGDLISHLQGLPNDAQQKVWDLIDEWAKIVTDDRQKANLRERIRRFAFTRRSKRMEITSETRDRARESYNSLEPKDSVIRYQWLFTSHWVEESLEELEDSSDDYKKREERIARQRTEALDEIWRQRGFEGVLNLVVHSGAAAAIGWHMGDIISDVSSAAAFLGQCLQIDDPEQSSKIDQAIAGFLAKLKSEVREEAILPLIRNLPSTAVSRLLRSAPFQRDTWAIVDSQSSEVRLQYWRVVNPPWLRSDSADLNEVIDRLLEVNRPRAAFYSVHLAFEQTETSRLKRLLQTVATSRAEAEGTYRLEAHDISSALEVIQGRAGITQEEMAQLEFLFIGALDHSEHGIPNLERQITSSPLMFVQVLALAFKRSDQGEDPPEWRLEDTKQRDEVAYAAYTLLDQIKRIPGTNEDGAIDSSELRAWITQVRALCSKYGRTNIGDHEIGKLLSRGPVGSDAVWPCVEIREVLEELGSREMADGLAIAVYNSRGVHWRGEGGSQERELAEKYRNWSRQVAFDFPFVAKAVEQIAAQYDREAATEDSDAVVRRRLGL